MSKPKKKAPARVRDTHSESKIVVDLTGHFQEALTMAEDIGLLTGARTELVRGRMPKALIDKARERSGVTSDTKLLELALATVAVLDNYPAWLLSQSGTISRDIDLEF